MAHVQGGAIHGHHAQAVGEGALLNRVRSSRAAEDIRRPTRMNRGGGRLLGERRRRQRRVNAVPRPGTLSQTSWPPCSWDLLRPWPGPKPVPRSLVVKKGSKMRASRSEGSPDRCRGPRFRPWPSSPGRDAKRAACGHRFARVPQQIQQQLPQGPRRQHGGEPGDRRAQTFTPAESSSRRTNSRSSRTVLVHVRALQLGLGRRANAGTPRYRGEPIPSHDCVAELRVAWAPFAELLRLFSEMSTRAGCESLCVIAPRRLPNGREGVRTGAGPSRPGRATPASRAAAAVAHGN